MIAGTHLRRRDFNAVLMWTKYFNHRVKRFPRCHKKVGSGFQSPSFSFIFQPSWENQWSFSAIFAAISSVVRSNFPNWGLVKQMPGEKNMPTRWGYERPGFPPRVFGLGVWISVEKNFSVFLEGQFHQWCWGFQHYMIFIWAIFIPYVWIKIRFLLWSYFQGVETRTTSWY